MKIEKQEDALNMKNGFFGRNAFLILILAVAISGLGLALDLKRTSKKIGYAETTILLSEFTEAIEARKKFEDSQKEWDKNLKTLNDSLMAAMSRMKSNYETAKQPEREKMRSDFQQRNDDLQRYTNAVKKMSEEKEKSLMEPVVKKMNSFLEVWGRDHGYDMIFGTMNGGNILQANSSMNLTRIILADLNAQYKNPAHPESEIPGKTVTDSASIKSPIRPH